jgi:hypothetical protein
LIKKAGGAEQYNANKRYAEAVTVAAEACADDTKGQTCYICTQALHWKTKEGLVRGCSCRGTAGFAHVSCLAEQAKILVAEAEENNLDVNPHWSRWYMCSLCEQKYHGVVACALGWACWKAYVGRPGTDQIYSMATNLLGNGLEAAERHEDALTVETELSRGQIRCNAMNVLGHGLCAANHNEAALSVQEATLATMRRLGRSEEQMLVMQGNLASTYQGLGRHEEALRLRRDVYSGTLQLLGGEHQRTLRAAFNYALSLHQLRRFEETKTLMRNTIPVAQRVFGESHELTLRVSFNYAGALYQDPAATLDDLREAVTTFEENERTARRVLGGAHPLTAGIETTLHNAQAKLRTREGDDVSAVRGALGAMRAT